MMVDITNKELGLCMSRTLYCYPIVRGMYQYQKGLFALIEILLVLLTLVVIVVLLVLPYHTESYAFNPEISHLREHANLISGFMAYIYVSIPSNKSHFFGSLKPLLMISVFFFRFFSRIT